MYNKTILAQDTASFLVCLGSKSQHLSSTMIQTRWHHLRIPWPTDLCNLYLPKTCEEDRQWEAHSSYQCVVVLLETLPSLLASTLAAVDLYRLHNRGQRQLAQSWLRLAGLIQASSHGVLRHLRCVQVRTPCRLPACRETVAIHTLRNVHLVRRLDSKQ